MARTAIQAIPPLHTPLIPPIGAEPAGVTLDGKHPLYRIRSKRATKKEKTDENGERVHRLHPTTGQPLYGLNEPVVYDHEEVFYLEADGRGNVAKVFYQFPTDEEIAAERRKAEIERMKEGLATALVDSGHTVEDVVGAVRAIGQRRTSAPAPVAESPAVVEPVDAAEPVEEKPGDTPPVELGQYPRHLGGNRWKLSNGGEYRGKKVDAIEAEKVVRAEQLARKEAAATAGVVPEV